MNKPVFKHVFKPACFCCCEKFVVFFLSMCCRKPFGKGAFVHVLNSCSCLKCMLMFLQLFQTQQRAGSHV